MDLTHYFFLDGPKFTFENKAFWELLRGPKDTMAPSWALGMTGLVPWISQWGGGVITA